MISVLEESEPVEGAYLYRWDLRTYICAYRGAWYAAKDFLQFLESLDNL